MNKKIAAKYVAAVNRGVKLLDVVRPGSVRAIDLGTIRLSSPAYCILGQLYGDFHDGATLLRCHALEIVRNLRLTHHAGLDEAAYGFNIFSCEAQAPSSGESFSFLTELWASVIEQRRAKDVAQERQRRTQQS